MPIPKFFKWLFIVAAIYDAVLGLVFLFAAKPVFDYFQTEYPNHWGYLHFDAMILLVFSVMFVEILRKPETSRNLIFYGILFKLSYSIVVIYYWLGPGLPDLWKPFAVIDLVFSALFYYAYRIVPTEDKTKI